MSPRVLFFKLLGISTLSGREIVPTKPEEVEGPEVVVLVPPIERRKEEAVGFPIKEVPPPMVVAGCEKDEAEGNVNDVGADVDDEIPPLPVNVDEGVIVLVTPGMVADCDPGAVIPVPNDGTPVPIALPVCNPKLPD